MEQSWLCSKTATLSPRRAIALLRELVVLMREINCLVLKTWCCWLWEVGVQAQEAQEGLCMGVESICLCWEYPDKGKVLKSLVERFMRS